MPGTFPLRVDLAKLYLIPGEFPGISSNSRQSPVGRGKKSRRRRAAFSLQDLERTAAIAIFPEPTLHAESCAVAGVQGGRRL